MRQAMAAVLMCTMVAAAARAETPATQPVTAVDLAAEVEARLHAELDLWFPRCIDTERGGYHQVYRDDWSRGADDRRASVMQARMMWVTATMAAAFPQRREAYAAHAAHGLQFINAVLVDREHGGVFWDRMPDGSPARFVDEKNAYSLGFVIYGAAAAHEVLPESNALQLARDTFAWLDRHGHDGEHGGYLEAFARDGSPVLDAADSPRGAKNDCLGTPYGYKSMNTHLHLLEAFTALHRVWPDGTLRARLAEIHRLMLEKMFVEPGAMHLHYTRDWQPVPGHNSYGHNVEAAYLLLESAAELGMSEDPRTLHVAKRLIDYSLRLGWDRVHGGLFYEGQAFKSPDVLEKNWWTQAESLNALLIAHEHFGRDNPIYGRRFMEQWRWIIEKQVDAQHGGWHNSLAADGTPPPDAFKGHHWKGCYHNGRALLEVAKRLRRLPPELATFQPAPPIPAATTQPAAAALSVQVEDGPNPWTHLNITDDPDVFQFAILPDVNGGERPGVLADTVAKLNLLQPRFVVGIGDYIPGHRKHAGVLDADWKRFFDNVAPLQPPLIYTPGGHDKVGDLMRHHYHELFGRGYFHFAYRKVLFLVLDSQDPGNSRFSPGQIEHVRRALTDNRDVRWTFVFIHRPLWEEKNPGGWSEVEQMLQDRPYTVFAGHIHRYLKSERFGREYYVLGTAGGANAFRGPDYGEIDHVTWVTMTKDKPLIANLEIGGIHRNDMRTTATADIAHHVQHVFEKESAAVAGEVMRSPATFELSMRNGSRIPMRVKGRFDPHPSIEMAPRVIDETIAPAGMEDASLNAPAPRTSVLVRLTPLREVSLDNTPPLKLVGVIEYHAEGGRVVEIPFEQTVAIEAQRPIAAGTAVVDGRLDEWGMLGQSTALPREVGGNGDAWAGSSDATSTFDLRADDRFLYFAAQVRDDVLIADHADAGDGLEIWLDARPAAHRRATNAWQKEIGSKYLRVRLVPGSDGTVAIEPGEQPPGMKVAGAMTGGDWTVELSIPVEYLQQQQGGEWTGLRLNVIIQDVDAAGEKAALPGWMPDWRWKRNIPASGTFKRSGLQGSGTGSDD